MKAASVIAAIAALPALAWGAPDGAALYSEHCAACHGPDLEGEPDWQSPKPDRTMPAPPHDQTGHTWHHGDRLLVDYIRLGGAVALERRGVTGFKSAMPAFGDVLNDAEVRAIIAFIKSQWPKRERVYQEQVTAQE